MSAPIIAIVGPNGGGKSLCAVEHYARPALESGRLVVSTMDIDGAELLQSHREIPKLRSCVLILDEISSAFPSRESSGMPAEIVRRLNQLRKVDVQVVWTAPAWERADKVLREVTNQVVLCRGLMPRYPWESTCPASCSSPTFLPFEQRYERGLSGGLVCPDHRPKRDRKGWPSNRLFSWRWFSAEMLQEFSLTQISHERGKARRRPQAVRWYRMPRAGTGAPSMYRTLDEVVLLDHLDTYGNCFSCGGSRRRPKCECERVEDVPRVDGEADPAVQFRRELDENETRLGPLDADHPPSSSSGEAS